MITLKDFIQHRIVEESKESEPKIEVQEAEVLEISELPDFISEANYNPLAPPPVLIMRRKSIRMFPDGKMVALYYVDKINKYVTVPYMASMWSTSMPEEWEKTNKD